MDYSATDWFLVEYDDLPDEIVTQIDRDLLRVLEEPGSAFARAGRIEGSPDGTYKGAWIMRSRVTVDGATRFYNIYWTYGDEGETWVLLIGLVEAP